MVDALLTTFLNTNESKEKVTISETITIKKELWDEMLSYKNRLVQLEEFVYNYLSKKVNLIQTINEPKCSSCFKSISASTYIYDVARPSIKYCSLDCSSGNKNIANCT